MDKYAKRCSVLVTGFAVCVLKLFSLSTGRVAIMGFSVYPRVRGPFCHNYFPDPGGATPVVFFYSEYAADVLLSVV